MSKSFHYQLSILVVLLGLHTPVFPAANTAQQYFDVLGGFRFDELRSIPASGDQDPIPPFSAEVWVDYNLVSYSLWKVDSRDDGGRVPMQLEVFETRDALGAFGAFSVWPLLDDSESEWQRLHLPVDNAHRGGELLFWRGNFLFHLVTADSSLEAQSRLVAFARALVDAIPLLNLHPLTLVHLPRGDLRRDSIRFFLGEASLALDHHLPPVLISRAGFEKDAEVIRAEYGPDGHALFLLGYPTPGVAAQYLKKLQKGLESYFSPQGVYMKRAGVLVGLFFGPQDKAQKILDEVRYTPTVRWVYKREVDPEEMRRATLGFLEAVRGTFLMVGFFLSVTLAAGVTVGLVRYQIFRLFPGLLKRDDVIFLEFDGPSS